MARRGWIPVLLMGALTVACPAPEPPDPDAPEPPDHTTPAVTCEDYVESGLAVRAGTREEFRAELGEPRRLESETEPNRHDPALTDTLFRLEYPGLAAWIRRPARLNDLLERVEVTDNRHLAYPELGVGAEAEAVVAALGEPDERTDARLVYACDPGPGPEEPVWFLVEDGRVDEVHFSFYVD